MAVEALGATVWLTEGSYENIKLTTRTDVLTAEAILRTRGHRNEDWPRLRRPPGRGGRDMCSRRCCDDTCSFGPAGHSDADVPVHALMDSLLGAAALGDIGKLFPDSDPEFRGADSVRLLRRVVAVLRERGYVPVNVDITIIAQQPKAGALYRRHAGKTGGGLRPRRGRRQCESHHGGGDGLYRRRRGHCRPRMCV